MAPEDPSTVSSSPGTDAPATARQATPTSALVVDDEPAVRELLLRVLRAHGVEASACGDAGEAERRLREDGGFDVVLLDVEMPGQSGWDLLERIRASGDETPVIFVTGRHEVDERLRGFELGADDYVVKPFDNKELVARVEAVVRRRRALPKIRIGDLEVDVGRRAVERRGRHIDVSPREFDLLRVLAEARGRTVSRAELLREVWSMEFDPGTSIVEVLVTRLRKKIDRDGPPMIQTLVGEGYRLAPSDPQRPS